jgi:hypothetical protein
MRFSIVCPIKDEVDLIPRTLPSFYSIHPDEVVLCLDKPASRRVVKVIDEIVRKLHKESITKVIEVERNPRYRFHQAWVRRQGFRAARNDALLTLDIDTTIDPRLAEYLHLLRGDVKLVSFAKFSLTWHASIAYLIHRIYRFKSFTGLYLFSKAAWLETEDEETLRRIPRSEDTYLHDSLTRRYRDIFVPGVRNIVLRPKESRKYQFLMGWSRWRIKRTPIWRVVVSTFLYFRPLMIVGYLGARLRDSKALPKYSQVDRDGNRTTDI